MFLNFAIEVCQAYAIKAAIFDLDGTLLDSMHVWKKIDEDFLAKRKITCNLQEYFDNISALSFRCAAEFTINCFKLKETPESLMREWLDAAAFEYGTNIAPKPYAKELLAYLKSYGIKLSTATSLSGNLAVAALKNTGLFDFFDAHCYTDETAGGKELPDVYLLAAKKLNIAPADCLVFEDLLQGIISAKKAGMKTVGVFDDAFKDSWQKIQQTADACIGAEYFHTPRIGEFYLKPDYSLYLVTDRELMSSADICQNIQQAINGGVTMVQLREKTADSREFYETALKVREVTARANVPLIINDRADIALAVDADGLHLGQNDLPCKTARKILGKNKIIGVSANNLPAALAAVNDGADYLGVGAMFPTGTKTDVNATSTEDLRAICKNISIPVVAIGGINKQNAHLLADTGIAGIAVVSAIVAHEDPAAAASELLNYAKR